MIKIVVFFFLINPSGSGYIIDECTIGGEYKAVIQKPFKRQKPASKRIGNAVVPKAKKMGR